MVYFEPNRPSTSRKMSASFTMRNAHVLAPKRTFVEIMATRCEKRQVEMDSSSWLGSGVMVAIMMVRQFPPRLSRRAMVIRLLRYGTWNRPTPRLRSCPPTSNHITNMLQSTSTLAVARQRGRYHWVRQYCRSLIVQPCLSQPKTSAVNRSSTANRWVRSDHQCFHRNDHSHANDRTRPAKR